MISVLGCFLSGALAAQTAAPVGAALAPATAAATAAPSLLFFQDLENFQTQNLTLQTERQRIEAASDVLLSKRMFWTPRLSVSGNQQRDGAKDTPETERSYLAADATWNLFKGGSDWNSMQSASAQKKAQELQVTNESLRVEIKASDLIFKSLYLTESKRIEEGQYRLKEESYKIANDRYAQGRLPLQDVTKAEVDLVQQRNRVRTAQLDVLENLSQVNALFINDVQTKAWPFDETASPKTDLSGKFPLIEQKYWLSQAREESWRSARGGHWPSLDLTFHYEEWPIKERDQNGWTSLLTLTIPIWSQYETSAKISSAYAEFVGAQNELRDTEQSLKQKAVFLKSKIDIARANLTEAKKNVEKSKRLYQDILKSFRLGRISTNDLILEQNRLFDSESALAQSQLTFHQTLIETCTLAGLRSTDCLK